MTTNGWRIAGWSLAALLLLLPAVAMRFTAEVVWTAGDFLFAGVMIGGTGLLLELIAHRGPNLAYRAGAATALAAVFLLVWINAAVGIIGDEGDPRNLAYAGVIALLLAGMVAARFRPRGMARALAVTAAGQAAAGVFAVVAGGDAPPGAFGLAILNGGFVLLFAAAAFLFRLARARATR